MPAGIEASVALMSEAFMDGTISSSDKLRLMVVLARMTASQDKGNCR